MIITSEEIQQHQGRLKLNFNIEMPISLGRKKKYQIIDNPIMTFLENGIWLVYKVLSYESSVHLIMEIPLFLFSKSPIITRTKSSCSFVKISDLSIRFIIDHNRNAVSFCELIKFDITSLFFVNKYVFGIKWSDWLSDMSIMYKNSTTKDIE